MSKKVIYNISGFDCPNCASKCEIHLNKQPFIEKATIDFNNEKLYVYYEGDEFSINELKKIIKEVESEPIKLSYAKASETKKNKIFDGETNFLIFRIVVSFCLILIARFGLYDSGLYIHSLVLYISALALVLYDIFFVVVKNIIKLRNPIDMHFLISVSSIGVFTLSLLIHYGVIPPAPFEINIFEGVLVVVLYQVGELFEHIATQKSKDAIKSAVDLRAKVAYKIEGANIVPVEPETLQISDRIVINIGDSVPIDGTIINGSALIDTSSLTGESLPVSLSSGAEVLSGMVVKDGSITVEVKKLYSDSTLSKIIDLIENSGENKSRTERFITRFARIYTPTVFAIGLLFALIYGLITSSWTNAIFSGLAIFVVACPCAIVVSVPLAYFAGIGLASKYRIIVKGASYLDALCNVGYLFVDKTGTLTYGDFKISDIYAKDVSKEELLDCLYAAESRSNHAIAKSICKGVDTSKYFSDIKLYSEVPGSGIICNFKNNKIIVGKREFLEENHVKLEYLDVRGTSIFVAKNEQFIGVVTLKDQVKKEAKILIKNLDKLGISTSILSGDKLSTVQEVAGELGISEYHHGLLPIDKVKFVEEAISKDDKLVAFAGDGINDTPSLVKADLGIAMGQIGSDTVLNNSDLIIMNDDPNKIYEAIKIARKVRFTALFNIVFSLLLKLVVIILVLTSVLGEYGMIVAVAADTGLTVVMVAHSLSLIFRKI